MLFTALAQVHPGLEPHESDGFVIITATSDQGMVNIHNRRPLELAPEHTREWIASKLSPERARGHREKIVPARQYVRVVPRGHGCRERQKSGQPLLIRCSPVRKSSQLRSYRD